MKSAVPRIELIVTKLVENQKTLRGNDLVLYAKIWHVIATAVVDSRLRQEPQQYVPVPSHTLYEAILIRRVRLFYWTQEVCCTENRNHDETAQESRRCVATTWYGMIRLELHAKIWHAIATVHIKLKQEPQRYVPVPPHKLYKATPGCTSAPVLLKFGGACLHRCGS